jgi:very-short-patch-repair endonuclease
MKKIHNISRLKERRKELRNSLTPAEAKLWTILKNSQLCGKKFRRQHSVGGYVLDFYCPLEKIAIELDGEIHNLKDVKEYDQNRTEYLDSSGIKVLRFKNKSVFDETNKVIGEIKKHFKK